MKYITESIKNIKNLLPYLLLIAIYFFFVNLEARKQEINSHRSNKGIYKSIKNIDIKRVEDLILVDIKATGFLYGMVRLIVGQLVLVGENKISPEIFTDRWVNKKKNDVKESAPAKGLCFVNAVYEENVFKKINNNDFFPVFLIKGFS